MTVYYRDRAGHLRSPQALREQAQALIKEADAIEEEPRPQDVYDEGTVIRFTKPGRYTRRGEEFGDGDETFVGLLKYAGIKAGDEWFLTGKHTRGLHWDDLLDLIGEENFDTAETFGPHLHTSWIFGR